MNHEIRYAGAVSVVVSLAPAPRATETEKTTSNTSQRSRLVHDLVGNESVETRLGWEGRAIMSSITFCTARSRVVAQHGIVISPVDTALGKISIRTKLGLMIADGSVVSNRRRRTNPRPLLVPVNLWPFSSRVRLTGQPFFQVNPTRIRQVR